MVPIEQSNKIITEKLGNAKEWCKNHFLNENKLSELKYEIKQIKRKFSPIIQRAKLHSKIHTKKKKKTKKIRKKKGKCAENSIKNQ